MNLNEFVKWRNTHKNNTNYSSISENMPYVQICKNAAEDDNIFNIFKSIPQYKDVLEHVTYEEGLAYKEICKTDELIIKNINKFTVNDSIGNPTKYNYDIGNFSPTTLRYIKTLKDLKDNYNLDNSNIIEIGAGYGGLYTIIKQLFTPKLYTFVDLKDVIQLIIKYTNTLKLNNNTKYIIGTDKNNIYDETYDLVISNYAFSECYKEIQEYYLNNILLKSKHGFIIHNNVTGYTSNELTDMLINREFKVKRVKETPQTGPYNVVLKW